MFQSETPSASHSPAAPKALAQFLYILFIKAGGLMKIFTLTLVLLFTIESHAIGKWKHTAAYQKCHSMMKDAVANCHTDYSHPNRLTRLLFTSDEKHDSFEHVTQSCKEVTAEGRKNQIGKYMLRYDSVNNVCYVGYTHSPSGKVNMTVFIGDDSRAVGTIPFESEKDLQEFIKDPDLKEVKTILSESIHQRIYDDQRRTNAPASASSAQGLE